MKVNVKSKKMILLLSAIVILAASGGYYALHQENKPIQQSILPPIKASNKVVAEGKVIPVKYSMLSFSVSGIVSQVLIEEGDKVEAGQVLVRLDSRELKAKSQSDQADLRKVQANHNKMSAGLRPQEVSIKQSILVQKNASYREAKGDFDRSQQLFAQGGVSQQQLDKDKATYLKTKAELGQAEADLDMAQEGFRGEDIAVTAAEVAAATAKLHGTQESIILTELRAPFSGTIASIELKVGEFVTTETAKIDENAEITDSARVQLADLSKWQIKTTDLTEINIARIKEGAEVKITFDAIPGLEIPGKVTRIRAFGEKKRGDMTYAVFVEPLQMDERMRWNMTATVSITTGGE